MAGMATPSASLIWPAGLSLRRGFFANLSGQLLLQRVVLGGLFLERFSSGSMSAGSVIRVRVRSEGDAVADVVAHVDDQAGDDVVHADHMVEAVLDLRHAQDADHGKNDQQHQHERKAQAQRMPTFMFDKFITIFPVSNDWIRPEPSAPRVALLLKVQLVVNFCVFPSG
jgi:hypothetical protein